MDFLNMKNSLSSILVRPKIELTHGTINDTTLVSKEFFKQKGWKLALFDRYFTCMQVDLFAQALNKLNIAKFETFLHNCEEIKYFKSVDSNYLSLKDIFYNSVANDKDWNNYEVLIEAIVITDQNLDFIVFIDEYREGYYFYGSKEFIDTIMPVSSYAFEDFFKSNYEIIKHNSLATDYLDWLWEHYIDNSC